MRHEARIRLLHRSVSGVGKAFAGPARRRSCRCVAALSRHGHRVGSSLLYRECTWEHRVAGARGHRLTIVPKTEPGAHPDSSELLERSPHLKVLNDAFVSVVRDSRG